MVKPAYGLDNFDITRMLRESFGFADDDMRRHALREQQVDAQRLIEATNTALASDADLLARDERITIDALLATLNERMRSDDVGAIKEMDRRAVLRRPTTSLRAAWTARFA